MTIGIPILRKPRLIDFPHSLGTGSPHSGTGTVPESRVHHSGLHKQPSKSGLVRLRANEFQHFFLCTYLVSIVHNDPLA